MTVIESTDVSATNPEESKAVHHPTVSNRPCLRLGKKDGALREGLNKAIIHHGKVREAWLIKKYLMAGLRAAGFAPAETPVQESENS